MGNAELVEKYAIMTLGVKKEPIPSETHIQKELFLLSNVNSKIKDYFDFEKHYYGPFSQVLKDVIEDPLYVNEAFFIKSGKIFLGKNGEDEYKHIEQKYFKKFLFKEMMFTIRLIREIYDKLSSNELLFLIYETYPEYTEFSEISEYIMKGTEREKIIKSLLSKGVISEEKYCELRGE